MQNVVWKVAEWESIFDGNSIFPYISPSNTGLNNKATESHHPDPALSKCSISPHCRHRPVWFWIVSDEPQWRMQPEARLGQCWWRSVDTSWSSWLSASQHTPLPPPPPPTTPNLSHSNTPQPQVLLHIVSAQLTHAQVTKNWITHFFCIWLIHG